MIFSEYIKKWFIPASIFVDYDFGRGGVSLYRKRFGAEYRVDYMCREKFDW